MSNTILFVIAFCVAHERTKRVHYCFGTPSRRGDEMMIIIMLFVRLIPSAEPFSDRVARVVIVFGAGPRKAREGDCATVYNNRLIISQYYNIRRAIVTSPLLYRRLSAIVAAAAVSIQIQNDIINRYAAPATLYIYIYTHTCISRHRSAPTPPHSNCNLCDLLLCRVYTSFNFERDQHNSHHYELALL